MTVAAPTPARTPRRLDIQGLRAVAVLLVVLDHASLPVSGGFVGVDVFFVISGYVITRLLWRELKTHGRVHFVSFYLRRAYRLLPALAVMSVVTATFSIFLVSPLGIQQYAGLVGGAATAWTANVALYLIASDYFSPHVAGNPYLHTWSLGVEEQFYLIFPALLWMAWSVTGRKSHSESARSALAVLGIFGLLSLLLSTATSFGWTGTHVPNAGLFAFYMSPVRFWEFVLGAALVLIPPATGSHPRFIQALGIVGSATLLASGLLITPGMPFPGAAALVPTFATALIIWSGAAGGLTARVLSVKPLTFIGDVSYSWYLWHWPLIVFAHRLWPDAWAAKITAAVLSFGVAVLSYRFVEQRFRVAAFPRPWRSAGRLAWAVLVPGLACSILVAGATVYWGDPALRRTASILLERPAGYRACLSVTPVPQRDLAPCTWGASRPGPPIYLFGDSNAQQWTDAFIGVSEQLDRPLIVATWGGCPFVPHRFRQLDDPLKAGQCSDYVTSTLVWLKTQPVGTVVMASSGGRFEGADVQLLDESGEPIQSPEGVSRAWRASLGQQVAAIQARGDTVVLVETIPDFPDPERGWWHPADCSRRELTDDPHACGVQTSRAAMDQRQEVALQAEKGVVDDYGILQIKVRDSICVGGVCETDRSGRWLYRDGLHVTPEFSRDSARDFAKQLSSGPSG